MGEKMARAEQKKKEIQEKQIYIQKEEHSTKDQQVQVQEKLSVIQPLVDEAISQVSNISKQNLDELKALRMPPEPCHDVLYAVLSLFGKQDTSWNAMKKFLGERGFIDTILNFDPKSISPKVMKEVTNIILKRASSFEKETIFKVSRAAGPLALWVKAILQFSEVLVQVAPLTQQLETIEKKLRGVKGEIKQNQDTLIQLNEDVAKLKEDFQ